jgi:hypothetical protein
MRKSLVLLLSSLTLYSANAAEKADVSSLLIQPNFAVGWKWEIEPEIYKPANLYEYNDGEAELYISYQFVEMVTASYMREDDEYASLTVDIYDVGEPLNAFGLYSAFRQPGLNFESIGEQAMVSDLNIRFYKGRHYVAISAGSLEPEVKESMIAMARQIAEKIDKAPLPDELTLLPAENQIPNSLKLLATGFLGQSVFKNTLQGSYRLGDRESKAFIVLAGTKENADLAFIHFRDFLKKQDQLTGESAEGEETKGMAESPYYGKIIFVADGPYVFGVLDYDDRAEAENLIEKIRQNTK